MMRIMALISYFKKMSLVVLINLAIVIALGLVRNNLSIQSVGKGMLYMGIVMFFFFAFALTGAGSLSKGDAKSHYIRSSSGENFNKMAGEYSKRSNTKINNLFVLLGSAALCGLIWLFISKFINRNL
jgi:hypothetical protein